MTTSPIGLPCASAGCFESNLDANNRVKTDFTALTGLTGLWPVAFHAGDTIKLLGEVNGVLDGCNASADLNNDGVDDDIYVIDGMKYARLN